MREALKWLVDYDGIADTIVKGTAVVHQSFLPQGFLGAIDDKPYKLDVAKAKALLEQAGLADGFKVTMDTRNATPLPGDGAGRSRRTGPRPGSSSRSCPATTSRR